MIRRALVWCLLSALTVWSCGDDGNGAGLGRNADQNMSHGETSGQVTFAVFGNTGLAIDNGQAFDQLIENMNNRGIDFAIDLGNCLPPGTPPGGADVMRAVADNVRSSIDTPVYPVAGPLDIFDPVSARTYEQRYGPLWYGFTRGGIRFLVLDTEDDVNSSGFGNHPGIGNEQLDWLRSEINTLPGDMPVALIMNRPLWHDDPGLWHDRLLPMLGSAQVVLALGCSETGLCDWGTIDGIHALTTGCTGPGSGIGPGCFPHALIVTMNGHDITFSVLGADGASTDGVPVTAGTTAQTDELASNLTLPPLRTAPDFTVSETVTFTIENPFDTTISGDFAFSPAPATLWEIRPHTQSFSLLPGERETIHIQIDGTAPELGPLPRYRVTAESGSTPLIDHVEDITLDIPKPRTGEVVTVNVTAPEVVPWEFDGSIVRIPVDIGSIDTCGRLIIYREDGPVPECIYISALVDFMTGLYEFPWNGRDMDGNPVTGGNLAYYLIAYNKTAPVSWVAEGPSTPGGTVTVGRELAGLAAETHTDTTIVSYPFTDSITSPESKMVHNVGELLDGLPLIGFTRGDGGRLYLGTERGIISTMTREGSLVPDRRFGNEGYVRLYNLRGRTIGKPVYSNGRLYLGIGGGNSGSPQLMLLDGVEGEILSHIDLGPYFGSHEEPPAITVTGQGIYLAHPDERLVLFMTHYGDIVWANNHGDSRIGAVGTDGRSFTYGIGVDQYGFSYVGAPGTSMRCGVLGPDGRGLFRVILVQVPGLRAAQTIPLIEGLDTDGLYFSVYGAFEPYLFHVPYTIRRGRIVHTAETYADDDSVE